MEEIVVTYYQIPLYQIQEIFKQNKLSASTMHLVPEVNFHTDYYFNSSTYGIHRVINNVYDNFSIITDWRLSNLEQILQITNAKNYPNALLRFTKNILTDSTIKKEHCEMCEDN